MVNNVLESFLQDQDILDRVEHREMLLYGAEDSIRADKRILATAVCTTCGEKVKEWKLNLYHDTNINTCTCHSCRIKNGLRRRGYY